MIMERIAPDTNLPFQKAEFSFFQILSQGSLLVAMLYH